MHTVSTATVCRTVVVLAFLVPLAVVARPDWSTAGLSLCLVALWAAPVLVAAGRRRGAGRATVLAPEPGEAPAG